MRNVLLSLLFKALPGPSWLRVLLVMLVLGAVGLFFWETGFHWMMVHFGSPLEGDPVSGG